MLFKVCSYTHGHFEELDRHAKGGGSQQCPHYGACRELVEHVHLSVHGMIIRYKLPLLPPPGQNFLDCLGQVLIQDAFEASYQSRIFDEAVSLLG